jgi:hypothetical protein
MWGYIVDRLELRMNPTPKFTATVTGNGNIKIYIHKYNITEKPKCSFENGEETVDHIIYSCNIQEQERDKLRAVTTRTG